MFNMEFQVGIRTDVFGRPVDDQAGPSIRRDDYDENNDGDEGGSDDDRGSDVGESHDNDDDVNNLNVEGENVDEQFDKQAREEAAAMEHAEKEAAEKVRFIE